MTEVAEAGRVEPDARVRRLVAWIREHMCPELPPLGELPDPESPPRWNDARVIVFTEYDDTKRYLVQHLSEAIAGTDRAAQRIEVYHGPTPPEKREDLKRAFNADPSKHPVRILICTDAAREGLNLQTHCADLFHFDVPWNPARMEQRNGRIDRKLQPQPVVRCHYFVYRQRPEDRILQVLVEKVDRIKEELGSLAPVLEGRLADSLEHGIRRADLDRLASDIDTADLDSAERRTVEEELEEARLRQDDLRDQIDLLRDRLEKSREWIGLEEEQFRAAISCALRMVGAEPLRETKDEDGHPRFEFPALDQRDGADPSWAVTLDSLRPPKPRDEKLWEWRSSSPIRPVVFEDPGTMDEGVVHFHLEHRVVQRLLGRFLAQGFVHHDLSRACLAQTTDAIPRVVLLGRLCLYGRGASRLHEEIVPVTARWAEPSRRKSALGPYAREAETKTLGLLEDALRSGDRHVTDVVRDDLQASAPQDVGELLPHLEERGNEAARAAEEQLARRGEQEAKAMRELLQRQRQRVADTIAEYRGERQLTLGFDADERRQLQANQRHWDKRLAELEAELETEPDRIRDVYRVTARRIEPVGLVYLWPVTG